MLEKELLNLWVMLYALPIPRGSPRIELEHGCEKILGM